MLVHLANLQRRGWMGGEAPTTTIAPDKKGLEAKKQTQTPSFWGTRLTKSFVFEFYHVPRGHLVVMRLGHS